MNGEMHDKQDFAAMKTLLISWHVEILYDLFKEEDIAIEELKMMQFRHINSFLKNYKMGVRIRFEHHFNNWRNRLGIPLSAIDTNRVNTCCCYVNNTHNNTVVADSTSKKRKINDDDLMVNDKHAETGDNQLYMSSHDMKFEKHSNRIATSSEVTLTPLTVLASPPTHRSNDTDEEEGENENCTLKNLSDFLTTTLEEEPPNFPSKSTPDKCPASLTQILELSGTRGMSITKFYDEKKYLTNIQRGQLIQIIVDFFDKNDYHLSLNMSHNLEWEILKLFPNEKLEYYRTEKRGKIYVKFSNMKRYKRERNTKVNTEIEITHSRPTRSVNRNRQLDGFIVESITMMDTHNNDGVDYPESADLEIEVKKEHIESV